MELKSAKILLLQMFVAVNIHHSLQTANSLVYQKAAYKSGEVIDLTPVTMDRIKEKLKVTGVFDPVKLNLTDTEKKELSKLYEAVEIMTNSRGRQPAGAQNMFSSLRILERALKKQLKEGQLSEALAAKFDWDKIPTPVMRHRRSRKLNAQLMREKSSSKTL